MTNNNSHDMFAISIKYQGFIKKLFGKYFFKKQGKS